MRRTGMMIHAPLDLQEHRLRSLLAAGLQQAQQNNRPVLVSHVLRVPLSDPLVFFERGARLAGDRLFWAAPRAEYVIAGVGAAWTCEVEGPGHFGRAATAWRDLCADALVDERVGAPGTGPLLLGGFAFDPARPATDLWAGYPDGRLVLPRYALACVDGRAWLTINTVLGPDSGLAAAAQSALNVYDLFDDAAPDPPPDRGDQIEHTEDLPSAARWKAIVLQLEQDLRRGDMQKVVLARQHRVYSRRPFDPAPALGRLRASYPDCFVFAVACGDSSFIGASPERLVRLRDGVVHVSSLAGSIARGATPDDDRRLGQELLTSAKDRAEHAFVVRAIRDTLAEAGIVCSPPRAPTLMKLRNVQHLFTPIVGRLASGGILEIVERLHPTPAVGGYPRAVALRRIGELEGLDRGWYAGPIGWLDARGAGEFAVAIRSALLRETVATLFAGCGLVAGSNPEREYAESCLKLRPMLSVLTGD
jgi:isochorismate synthase